MNQSLVTMCIASALMGGSVLAADIVMVGGQNTSPAKTIIDNAASSADHTTFVTAVKAAGLVETLQGAGPFTVFAPTDAAFAKLPAGTVENLLKPESKTALTKLLTYHVVAGRLSYDDLARGIKRGNGVATLTTVSGDKLTAMMNGEHNIVLKDVKGRLASISTYDVRQSNGVVHVIDTVVMP